MREPVVIAEEMLESKALQIESRFGTLGINYYVFETNYEELKRLLRETQTPEQMWRSGETNAIMYELTRLLHNFLASAKMLVDHTRYVMADWYSGTTLHKEYQSQIQKRFATNKLSRFIEDFRNYALHYQLPVTMSKIEVTRDSKRGNYVERVAFHLSRTELRKWSNWDKGKGYLYRSDENIVIENLVDQYFRQVQDLHQWIGGRLADEHAEDLRWLEDRRKELEEALKKADLLQREEAKPDWPLKIPRNAPCPCGSGRKYKHCCGKS